MNVSQLYGFQEAGFVKGFTLKTLAEANRLIGEARKATPEKLREQFRSSIRADGDGYTWAWVMK